MALISKVLHERNITLVCMGVSFKIHQKIFIQRFPLYFSRKKIRITLGLLGRSGRGCTVNFYYLIEFGPSFETFSITDEETETQGCLFYLKSHNLGSITEIRWMNLRVPVCSIIDLSFWGDIKKNWNMLVLKLFWT